MNSSKVFLAIVSIGTMATSISHAATLTSQCPFISHPDLNSAPVEDSFRRYAGVPQAKGEYETTAEFTKRQKGKLEAIWGEASKAQRGFAGPIAVSKINFGSKYDADTETLVLADTIGTMFIQHVWARGEHYDIVGYAGESTARGIGAKFVYKNLGIETKQNAFGVTADVWKSVQTEFNYAFGMPDEKVWLPDFIGKTIRIKVPRAQVKAVQASLEVAVAGSLKPPYFATTERYEKPTLDRPRERVSIQRTAFITPICAVVRAKIDGVVKILAVSISGVGNR